jgi:CRISPR-associated endonuclease Csn1
MNKNLPLKDLFNAPENIVSPKIKARIQERILQFNGDAKKAFASVKKEPIYLDKEKTQLLSYGSLFSLETVLKYAISSIKEKDLKDVVDDKIRMLLKQRIDSVGEKDAFKAPLYIDANKKIQIKSVRIKTGLDSVVPVRKNESNEPIAFVKPGNNHHMAFYKDMDGKFVPHICSFWHGVERKKYKLPVVIQEPQKAWDMVLENPEKFPEEFTQKLPNDKWEFILSLQQNEMFILGLDQIKFEELFKNNDYDELGKYLYRTQKMTIKSSGSIEIWFRLQTETNLVDDKNAKSMKRYFNFSSINSLLIENPIKVKINTLGEMFL